MYLTDARLTDNALAVAADRGRRVAAQVHRRLALLAHLGELEFAAACDQARLNLAREADVIASDLAVLNTRALLSSTLARQARCQMSDGRV